METRAEIDGRNAAAAMPARLRWGVVGVLGLLFAGALYLIAVRGEALLLDLSALGRVFCF